MGTRALTAALLSSVLWASPALAAPSRVVVVAKLAQDGAAQDAAGLDSAATEALRGAGARIVDLDAALAAQRAAFADSVLEGKVPRELSVLNADAVLSVRLACGKAESVLKGYPGGDDVVLAAHLCSLAVRFVKTDSGDVLHSSTRELKGHGLTALQAVQGLLGRQVPAALKEDVAAWSKRVAAGALDLDVVVVRPRDREQLSQLAARLGTLAQVEAARVVVVSGELGKVSVRLRSTAERGAFVDALLADPSAPLRVVYESESVLQVQPDFERAHRRAAAVFFALTGAAEKRLADPAAVLAAELRNVALLDAREPQRAGVKATRVELARKAKDAALLLVWRAGLEKGQWTGTVELVAAKDASAVAVAPFKAADPIVALDGALRDLDQRYRLALGQAAVRRVLGLDASAAEASAPVRIESLAVGRLAPSRLPAQRKEGIGTLALRNASGSLLTDLRVRYEVGGRALSEERLPDLPAGAVSTTVVRLDALPEIPAGSSQAVLTAVATFQSAGAWGRVEAFAPLVVADPGP